MINFNIKRDTLICFGKGEISKLCDFIKSKGYSNVLLTYGFGSIKKNGVYDASIAQLKNAGVKIFELSGIDPNPRIETVLKGRNICKENNIDFILAVGGGSVLDCSKAISIATGYKGKDEDFWTEIIASFKGDTIEKVVDVGVVLTLAATGSEMNSGGVISNLTTKEKLPIFSSLVVPKIAILDPSYTFSVPKNQIAAGIVDSFSHCLEQYFSKENNFIPSDYMLLGLMKCLVQNANVLMKENNNYIAHANLMWTATMALNNITGAGKTADWSVHFIEHAVSAFYDITHAVGLAVLTPYWMEYVVKDADNLSKFVALADVFGIDKNGISEKELVNKVISECRKFFDGLGMPDNLQKVGAKIEDIDGMVVSSLRGADKIGNFKDLYASDVKNILINAFGK